MSVPEGYGFDLVAVPGTPTPQGSFAVAVPLRTKIGNDTYEFGSVLAQLADPELVSQGETADGDVAFRFTTPDRTIRYVRHDGLV